MPDPAAPDPDYHALVRRHLPPLAVRPEREQEIVAELAQLLEDAARSSAVDPADQQALARFIAEQVPEWQSLARAVGSERAFPWSGLGADLRSALRLLGASPLLTATTVATLAIAIGLNSAVFSLVNAVLFRPLGVERPAELVRIYSHYDLGSFLPVEPLAYPDYLDLRDGTQTLSAVAAYSLTTVAIEVGGETGFSVGEMVTGNYFETLGLLPARGRLLLPVDDAPGTPAAVILLGHDLWQSAFGSRTDIVGQSVRVNGRPAEVVGVVPPSYRGLLRGIRAQLWLPMGFAEQINATAMQSAGDRAEGVPLSEDRARRYLWGIARRAVGRSFAMAQGDVAQIGAALAAAHPVSNKDRELLALPLGTVHLLPGIDDGLRLGSAILLSLVGLVLLIACANLASLLLARAAARTTEMATRLALGASRGRILRQLLLESLLLAVLGGALGLALAYLAGAAFAAFELPTVIPLDRQLPLDRNVLTFTITVACLAALAFGLLPALACARTESAGLLRAATRRGGGRGKQRGLRALVVAQVALSTLLLVCAGMVIKSARQATRIPRGIEARGVVIGNLDPQRQGQSAEQSADTFRRLLEEARAQPEVAAAAFASHLPLTLWINTWAVVPERERGLPEREWHEVDAAFAGEGYFPAAGVRLLSGRGFERGDIEHRRRVAVVNRAFADRFFPAQSAIAERILTDPDEQPWEIVGVSETGKYRSLGEEQRPFVFLPLSSAAAGRFLVLRVHHPGAAGESGLATFQRVVRSVDPQLAIMSFATLEQATGLASLLTDLGASLFALFGVIGMLLAMTGLYGVLAYTVAQRTHELGVRVALGAAAADVLRLVAATGLRLVVLGLVLGLVAAGLAGQALRGILYGVSPRDPATNALVALALAGAASLACWLPARRALRIDPLRALRHD